MDLVLMCERCDVVSEIMQPFMEWLHTEDCAEALVKQLTGHTIEQIADFQSNIPRIVEHFYEIDKSDLASFAGHENNVHFMLGAYLASRYFKRSMN